jgi:hypothetical protein
VPDPANSNPRRARQGGDSRTDAASSSSPEQATAGATRYRAATQDRLGQALSDLLENPLVTGAIGHAWGAREKAAQAQELWMGALNIPSTADVERLTRRLRSVSQRLEGVEDGVQRLGRTIVQGTGIDARLESIDERLERISVELQDLGERIDGLLSAERAGAGASSTASPRSKSPSRSRSATAASGRRKR